MLQKILYISLSLMFFQLSVLGQKTNHLDSALLYFEYGDFDKSMDFINQISNSGKISIHNRVSALKAKILGQNGLYSKAFQLLDDATFTNDISYIEVINAKGYLLQNQGYPNNALEQLELGLKLLQKENNSSYKNQLTIENLSLSAIAYWQLNAYEEANNYLKQVLSLNQKTKEQRGIANCYINLGLINSTNDTYKAQYYYETALEIYHQIYPHQNHPSMASIYINLGIIFEKNFLLDKAIAAFEKASTIWENTYGSDHTNIAFVYINIGEAYLKNNQIDLAIEFYSLALSIYEENFGENHPEIANIHIKLGDISYDKGNTNEALIEYQKALISNNKSFHDNDIYSNPSTVENISPFITMIALQKKAVALEKRHFTKTLRRKDLEIGIEGLFIAHQIIQNVRTSQNNKADKIRLSEITNDIYSDGIHLCLSLANASLSESKWIKEAFNFVEWSKAASLLASIQETNAKSFSGIPTALVEKENNLQEKIYSLEQQALKSQPNELAQIEDALFSSRTTLRSHIKELEKEYPKYHDLKYKQDNISYDDIQNRIAENEALISYFISDKENLVYIFVITKGNIKYFQEEFNEEVRDEILSLETGLKFNFDEIITLSTNYLSRVLLPFTLPKKIQKITFLLDGQINTIPMDIMLTKEVVDLSLPLKKYPFIIKDYAICYNFSATLAYPEKEQSNKIQSHSIASFAPVVFQDSSGRDVLNSLLGSLSEVGEISTLFKNKNWESKSYTYSNAKKSHLKSDNIHHFDYLHFATHGFVDEEHPNQSYIYLLDDNEQEGLLRASEIYNLNLQAKLVTLSACETGLGKLSKGEGLIGLSRALKYSGVENSIVSLWAINDLSTALLMQHFYKEITEGIPISTALQNAKIKLIQEGLYFSPYYWASFTLIGRH